MRRVSLGDAPKTNGAVCRYANFATVAASSWEAFIQEVAWMESQDRVAMALCCPLTAIQGQHQVRAPCR